ncbi:hypothetical protein AAFN90_02620 [Erwiniaceae bacterium CAU 1747]
MALPVPHFCRVVMYPDVSFSAALYLSVSSSVASAPGSLMPFAASSAFPAFHAAISPCVSAISPT